MQKLIAGTLFGLLLGSVQLNAASRRFDFHEAAIEAVSTYETAKERLFELVNTAIMMADDDSAKMMQMSPQEMAAWQSGFAFSDEVKKAWLSGASLQSDQAAAWFFSKLTGDLKCVITAPLKNGESALEMAERAGNKILTDVIKKLCLENPR